MRPALKRIGEAAILHGGAAAIGRYTRRNRVLILAYHNIVPQGGQPGLDTSLHLPLESFVSQLDAIRQTHEVVSLADLMNGAPLAVGKPLVALTFDDAYRGAVQVGVPEVVRQGMSATVFICPDRLGDLSFWWDRVEDDGGHEFDSGFREFALTRLAGREDLISEFAAKQGWASAGEPEHIGCATLSELQEIAALPGITFGSHSWSHPNLSALSEADIEIELRASGSWLHDHFPNTIPCISYPYGKFDDRVAAAADRCGYSAGLAIEGGWMTRQPGSRFAVPRLNVPAGLSEAGFGCRLAGLFCA